MGKELSTELPPQMAVFTPPGSTDTTCARMCVCTCVCVCVQPCRAPLVSPVQPVKVQAANEQAQATVATGFPLPQPAEHNGSEPAAHIASPPDPGPHSGAAARMQAGSAVETNGRSKDVAARAGKALHHELRGMEDGASMGHQPCYLVHAQMRGRCTAPHSALAAMAGGHKLREGTTHTSTTTCCAVHEHQQAGQSKLHCARPPQPALCACTNCATSW